MTSPTAPGIRSAALDANERLSRSMPMELAETLRSQIHGGQLGPGDRLPNERDLAALLGVGRVTVREAIRMLVDDGYLYSKRGNSGGTFVSDLARPRRAWIERIRQNPEWVIDLIEYRKAIEMRAAELAAARRRHSHLAEMRRAIADGVDPDTRKSFRLADHRFHVTMAEASGSKRLTESIISARGELFLPIDQLPFRERFAQTYHDHAAILDAIDRRDPPAARDAAEKHLEASLKDFVDLLVTSRS